MPFKLSRLATLFTLAALAIGGARAEAHPRVERCCDCCCHVHVVHRRLARVRTVIREHVVVDHIDQSEWRPVYQAPAQELQISSADFGGGVGPAFMGGGGGGGGYVVAGATANASAGASASAAVQASIAANIAVQVGIGAHGGHGGGKGGHW
jgi:hypothetical protein